MAPNSRLADKVVDRAEAFRSRIGTAWLGDALPATRTKAIIYVEIDESKSFARTLVAPAGEGHMMWLVGSEQAVTKHLLAHEMAHVVMADQFGDTMPIWANEGIASRYDNPQRHTIRDGQLRQFVAFDSWPQLDRLFRGSVRQPWQYAAAVSVADYLIQRGGRERFVEFVADSIDDVDAALQRHYGIASISELQQRWQRDVEVRCAEPPLQLAIAPTSARSVR